MSDSAHAFNLTQRGDFTANKRMLLLAALAVPIGATCTGIAYALVKLIDLFTNLFFYGILSFEHHNPGFSYWGILACLVPMVGGLIIGCMARFGTEKIRGHGIPEALEVILFGKSIMNLKVAILKPLSSAISIGSGGPFGAEGPIIMTGGAFGSLFAQIFKLSSAERKTLLVAGAAAGMSAVFATPIAAVLLAVELLLFEWRPRSLVPVAIASAIAAGLRPLMFHEVGPLFGMQEIGPQSSWCLLAAVGVGILGGAFSTLLSSTLYKLEDFFSRLPVHWMWWPALGGLAVGIGGFIEPRVLGVGFDVIRDLLGGQISVQETLIIVALKLLVWVIALASGTSGGVLAPLLMMGAGLGLLEAQVLPGATTLWPLVSMAAVMGGMMRSPFTAVIFAFELTHEIGALPELLVASVVSYAFTVLVMKRSILTEKVARRGYDIYREYDVDPLERMVVKDVMTKDVVTVAAMTPIREITDKFFAIQKHRGYPIVDENSKLIGVLASADLLRTALEGEDSPRNVGELISKNPVVIYPFESCRMAAQAMAKNNVGRLIVVDPKDPKHIIGIVTRSDLLKARTRAVEEEEKRERIWRSGNSKRKK